MPLENGCSFPQIMGGDQGGKATAFHAAFWYTVGSQYGGGVLRVYLDLIVILNFIVDFLLILGTNRLTGHSPGIKKATYAALLGGIYAGFCLLPEFRFLGNRLWRLVFLLLISIVAFGCDRNAVQRGAVFFLLSMALGGIASGTNGLDFAGVCFCGGLLWFLCRIGFRGSAGQREYVTVELNWNGSRMTLVGLRDTGNTLRDPLTGESVLICGADVGEELFGLNRDCFCDPAGIMASGKLPGMRLIPYCTVGQSGGLLVVLRLKGTKINGRICDPLVAFAPREIGAGAGYRMLTGGAI